MSKRPIMYCSKKPIYSKKKTAHPSLYLSKIYICCPTSIYMGDKLIKSLNPHTLLISNLIGRGPTKSTLNFKMYKRPVLNL